VNADAFIKVAAWVLALGLLLLPVVAVLNGWLASGRWPVRQLVVHAGFEHVDAARVRAAVQPLLGAGFFAVRPDAVRAAVAALPWVARAEVRKRWPDTIELTIHEQQPVAHWGADRLVNRAGEIFAVADASMLEGLPQLDGPDARVHDVLLFLAQCRQRFAGTGLGVGAVSLSARGGWRLVLDTGTVLEIGREHRDARLERFLDVWPRLAPSHAEPPLSIDLRYENGFAVRWAPSAAAGAAPIGNAETRARPASAAPPDVAWRAHETRDRLAGARFPTPDSLPADARFPMPPIPHLP